MAEVNTGAGAYGGQYTDAAARFPQAGAGQDTSQVAAAKARELKMQQGAVTAGAQQPTPEEAAIQMQFYNKALGDISALREQKYAMPAQKQQEGGAPAQTASTAAAGPLSEQELQLNADARKVVQFNLGRLNEMERSGQLPAPLPFDQAQENFMTVVGYLNKSSEAKSNPAIQGAMKENIAKAQSKVDELKSNAEKEGAPMDRGAIREAFVRELAQCVGQDDRIPPAFSLSAIDYTRAEGNAVSQ